MTSEDPAMPTPEPRIAPYGTWTSPLDATTVAAGSRPLSAPRSAGSGRVRWLEGLPEEGGRVVVVERAADGTRRVITPAGFNVRTRAHEYGGGAWAQGPDALWFSNFADNLVYEQAGDGAPRAITTASTQRHADLEPDLARRRVIAVREDHGTGAAEAVTTLVALGLDAPGSSVTLDQGADFCSSPRVSPEGRRLAWLRWHHPHMPWEGTELWLAAIADDGSLIHQRRVAGGPTESLVQPQWGPDGRLYVVSDRSGFWNLYRVDADGLAPLWAVPAEFARPQWVFGQCTYGFPNDHEIVAVGIENARARLWRVDTHGRHPAIPIAMPFADVAELRVEGETAIAQAGSPTMAEAIVRIDLTTGAHEVLARSVDAVPDARYLSVARPISYPSADDRTAHAFHYAPHNEDFRAPDGERPPLIVVSHGGPTSMSPSSLRLMVQFWTSRGFAFLEVNYGGSTGFGRAYRELLSGQWGIVDVEDCIAGARYLARHGQADPDRLAIRGGSAGGYTTLCALAFHDVFKAGASYYGVGDLRALDADTHKFESRYSNDLLAPPGPERERLYEERSPLLHAQRLSCPVIFFQGLDDKVVLPSQSETMFAALKDRGVPAEYLAFEGEGHGFRKKDTIRRALEAELAFYATVFGFSPGVVGGV
jgi:dipeptidyl aminopeptidase/acylaminoacyl peptidase